VHDLDDDDRFGDYGAEMVVVVADATVTTSKIHTQEIVVDDATPPGVKIDLVDCC